MQEIITGVGNILPTTIAVIITLFVAWIGVKLAPRMHEIIQEPKPSEKLSLGRFSAVACLFFTFWGLNKGVDFDPEYYAFLFGLFGLKVYQRQKAENGKIENKPSSPE